MQDEMRLVTADIYPKDMEGGAQPVGVVYYIHNAHNDNVLFPSW